MKFFMGQEILEEADSSVNGKIRVVKALGLGTYIQVENLTQSGGVVYDVWNSTLKRLKGRRVNNALVLGLGGGSAAMLLRKYWKEVSIIGIDIDSVMVEMGKKYLNLDKLDLKTHIQDAEEFLLKSTKFDLILVDLYVGTEVPEKFSKEKFVKLAASKLNKGGIAIFNRLYYGEKRKEAVKFGESLEKVFKSVERFFPEANIMYICRL